MTYTGCQSSNVSSGSMNDRTASCKWGFFLQSESIDDILGDLTKRNICHTADMPMSSPRCESSCVSSGALSERRTSDTGSRHRASPQCDSEYDV